MSEEFIYIERIAGLIIKYHREELSEEEVLELNVWCAQSTKNQALFDQLSDPDFVKDSIRALPDIEAFKIAGWEKVMSGIDHEATAVPNAGPGLVPVSGFTPGTESVAEPASAPVKKTRWLAFAAAAVFLGLIVIGGWMYWSGHQAQLGAKTPAALASNFKNDVAPGGSKAVLTLSDGSTVVLDSAGTGTIAQQGGSVIKKNTGALSYITGSNGAINPSVIAYNTLTTPAAGQFQVTLPDGSKVWLNNASSLRYPVAFTGKERVVDLKGEAYFEIAKNAAQPFKVKVGETLVDVLGTSFNISAYPDEAGVVKTTLLTGAVRVGAGHATLQLKPGEQAVAGLSGTGDLKLLKDIDTDNVIAWKNGLFHFERADIQSVMRVLARWYDVEVVYEGAVPGRQFGGEIQRNLNLSQVLEILQKNQVHFELEGRKITVRP